MGMAQSIAQLGERPTDAGNITLSQRHKSG
jgi:hypothetical protein